MPDMATKNGRPENRERLYPESEIDRRVAQRTLEDSKRVKGDRNGPRHDVDITDRSRARERADELYRRRGWKRLETVKAEDLDNYDDGGFRSVAEYLRTIRDARTKGKFDSRLEQYESKAPLQQEGVGADGGFTVPAQFEAMIRMRADAAAPWLNRTMRYEARSSAVFVPAVTDDDRSSEEVAGFKLSRTGEGATLSADKINFRANELRMRKAAGLVTVSNELLTDEAVGLDDVISRVFGRAEALMCAEDFMRGGGGGEPLGILNSSAVYEQAKESGPQTADTVVFANIYNMFSRLAPESHSSAVWIVHPGVFPQFAQFVGGSGSDLGPNWLVNAAGRPSEMLGLPIYYHETASLLGDKGDVNLVDPSWYMYARQPLRIDMSTDRYFDEDATAWRIVLRDDGQPFYDSTWTDTKGYVTSPFVTLAERA